MFESKIYTNLLCLRAIGKLWWNNLLTISDHAIRCSWSDPVQCMYLILLGLYFLCNWLIVWQNALYLYQEICCSNISSGFIKDMKINPINKWRKASSLNLDKSSTILLSRINEEAWHKLDLSRSTISKFLDLKFSP